MFLVVGLFYAIFQKIIKPILRNTGLPLNTTYNSTLHVNNPHWDNQKVAGAT